MSSPQLNYTFFCHGYTVRSCFHAYPHDDEHHNHRLQQSRNPIAWSSNICHCWADPLSCCTTFFCPCIAFGRIAEYTDEGSSSCLANGTHYCLAASLTVGFGACFWGYRNRRKMRTRFGWEKKPRNDCCAHCFCHCCALCQEYRHIQSLKGPDENGQMRNGSIGMTPPPTMGMYQR